MIEESCLTEAAVGVVQWVEEEEDMTTMSGHRLGISRTRGRPHLEDMETGGEEEEVLATTLEIHLPGGEVGAW